MRHHRRVSADSGTPDLERELLGGELKYTRLDVSRLSGVPVERSAALWRALGFADVGDDNVAFTEHDVEALRSVERLVELGVIDADTQQAMTRAMGQALSRLAEWQVTAITAALARDGWAGSREETAVAHELVPVMEGLLGYVWRRHLAAVAGRLLGVAPDELDSRSLVVGFADLVGFTTLTRHVSEDELAALVGRFEAIAADVVAECGGRVVKTVGDEVMFAVDDPATGAEVAMRIAEQVGEVEELPDVRVGVAFGAVLSRLGDVYGEPVNLASRLTSVARPGTVLIDRELAMQLEGVDGWRLRRIPRRPVRGYPLLAPVRLRRAPTPAASLDS
jgi:adenylate cyclase